MPPPAGEGEAERGEKRPGAFRTITEVARELAVEPHVLRFWESRFAQIRPIKRAGGRRYYRPDDVDLLRGVRQLLHGQGYTIRGAQRILKGQGVRFVQAVGRGEARAGAPSPQERDMREMRDEQGNELGPEDRGEPPAPADRAALEAVLRELRACRDILAEIGSDEPADPV